MNWLTAIVGSILLMSMAGAGAQTYYVDDRLQVGMHAQPELSSSIVELLPSGTELQILERAGKLARVRTDSGAEGWVDTNFINSVQPARERLQALETELAGTQATLADLQAKLVVMEQLPKPLAVEQSSPVPSDTLREMQSLAEENQRLKQQLAERDATLRLARQNSSAASATQEPQGTKMIPATVDEIFNIELLKQWQLLLLASVLLLAFSIGGWLVDWGVRRRHGGFRI